MLAALPGEDRTGILGDDSSSPSSLSSLMAATELSASLCRLIELAVRMGACLCGVKPMLADLPGEDRIGILGAD